MPLKLLQNTIKDVHYSFSRLFCIQIGRWTENVNLNRKPLIVLEKINEQLEYMKNVVLKKRVF